MQCALTSFRFNVDRPSEAVIAGRLLAFEGWFCVTNVRPKDIEVRLNGRVPPNVRLFDRPDVVAKPGEVSTGWTFWVDVEEYKRPGSNALVLEFLSVTKLLGTAYFRCRGVPPSGQSRLSFFIHVPKTGGTTLRALLDGQRDNVNLVPVYDGGIGFSKQQFKRLKPAALSDIDVIFGHFDFGLHSECEREFDYLAILRDPYDFLVSHYFFRRYTLEDANYTKLASIFEMLKQPQIASELDNVFCRMLCGNIKPGARVTESDLTQAKDNVRRHFRYIGLTEFMGDSLRNLSRLMGLQLDQRVGRLNASPLTNEQRSLDNDELKRAFHDWVRFDLDLYQFVLQEFWGSPAPRAYSPATGLKLFRTHRRGAIDGLIHLRLLGWAVADGTVNTKAEVVLYLDGTEVARGLAARYRADVQNAGHGDGFCGFEFELPEKLSGKEIVHIRLADTEAALVNGGLPLERYRSLEQSAYGTIDGRSESSLVGWVSMGDQPANVTLYLDGKEIATATANRLRPDLAKAGFGSTRCGFELALPRGAAGNEVVHVRVANTGMSVHASGLALESYSLLGAIDGRIDDFLIGWLHADATSDRGSEVVLFLDGEEVTRTKANHFRADLAKAGFGDGHCGFRFKIPATSSGQEVVFVRLATSNAPIRNSGTLLQDFKRMRMPPDGVKQ